MSDPTKPHVGGTQFSVPPGTPIRFATIPDVVRAILEIARLLDLQSKLSRSMERSLLDQGLATQAEVHGQLAADSARRAHFLRCLADSIEDRASPDGPKVMSCPGCERVFVRRSAEEIEAEVLASRTDPTGAQPRRESDR